MYMYIYSPFCTNDIHAKIRMRFSHIYMVHYCFVFFKAWLRSKSKAKQNRAKPSRAKSEPHRRKIFPSGLCFFFFGARWLAKPGRTEPNRAKPIQSHAAPKKKTPSTVFP